MPRPCLAAVPLLALLAAGPAAAKRTKPLPCETRFVIDATPSSLGGASRVIDAVAVEKTVATVSGACSARVRLHRTRHGWRLRAHWASCAGLRNVRLAATLGFDCGQLTARLRARHLRPARIMAHASTCGGKGNFASTWEAIQQTIFARHDCANDLCHGSAKQGGLDLRPAAAYESLVQVPSTEVPSLNRVEPGDERRSYLYLKLLAKTDPAHLAAALPPGVQLSGSPMPNNATTLSADELETLRLWIYATAPRTGTVPGTERLLDACLPAPTPIAAIPLPPPPPAQGLQFAMPPWPLPANSEHEVCFATYYDLTGRVPAEFTDGNVFYWNAQTLRQDPQSHHLILSLFAGSLDQIHDPSFGTWRCNGG